LGGWKVRGIFPRGKHFGITIVTTGRRYGVNLGTGNGAEACQGHGRPSGSCSRRGVTSKKEIEGYVNLQRETGASSRNSAEDRRPVLPSATDFFEITEPARLNAQDVQPYTRVTRGRRSGWCMTRKNEVNEGCSPRARRRNETPCSGRSRPVGIEQATF